MTPAELKERFPNASAAFIRANTGYGRTFDILDHRAGALAHLERNLADGTVGAVQVQGTVGKHFRVRVKSYRKRLLDEDNLCEKYHVDLLRYAGVIPKDSPGTAKIEVCQEKVGPKEPERVEIEVYEV